MGAWQLIGSAAIEYEIDQNPDKEKAAQVRKTMALFSDKVHIDDDTVGRAEELARLGFSAYDAMHIACAEKAQCDVLLTTNDWLLKRAQRHIGQIGIRIEYPLKWIEETL